MKIKKFLEMFEDKYDYQRIINILKKTYGWGNGVITSIDDFESNPEYFSNPPNDDDYIEQFHIYLTDLGIDRMRGEYNKNFNVRLGKWKLGTQANQPTSIYNKLY